MAPREKTPTRDFVYLLLISAQLLGMLVLDLTAFYPQPLASALLPAREAYLSSTSDPFFGPESPPWFHAYLYVEGLVQLPLAVYVLASRAGYGRELALLVFGCVTATTSLACCAELLAEGGREVLVAGAYGPYVVIPALMSVDMCGRLAGRLSTVEGKGKAKMG